VALPVTPQLSGAPTDAAEPRWEDLIALGALAACVLVFGLGGGSLRDWDEAIYAQVSREIWESGDWLTPLLHGKPWFEKPPLYFWFTAASFEGFGVGELAPRLGAALSGIATILLTYSVGTRALGRMAGLTGAVVLLGTAHFLTSSKMGMLDVPLTAAIALALYCWWRGLQSPAWFLGVGAAIGLGVMTKGAAAGLAPITIAIHLTWTRQWRVLRSPYLWAGVALSLAVAAPWHLAAWRAHGQVFLDDYLGYHLLARAGGAIEGHAGGPLFYLGVLIEDQRPWVLATLLALPFALWHAARGGSAGLRLAVAWAATGFLLPTLMSTKLEWYLMPAYPALSLCIGFAAAELVPVRLRRGFLAVALVIVVLNLFVTKRLLHPDYNPEVKQLASEVIARVPAKQRLCVYRRGWPSVRFYTERRTRQIRAADDERLARLLERSETVWCVVREQHLEDLKPLGAEVRAQVDDHLLVAIPGRPGA
jgi:4-amino-4-deoxy-L-arabinose transferase-like glycosyltransferase